MAGLELLPRSPLVAPAEGVAEISHNQVVEDIADVEGNVEHQSMELLESPRHADEALLIAQLRVLADRESCTDNDIPEMEELELVEAVLRSSIPNDDAFIKDVATEVIELQLSFMKQTSVKVPKYMADIIRQSAIARTANDRHRLAKDIVRNADRVLPQLLCLDPMVLVISRETIPEIVTAFALDIARVEKLSDGQNSTSRIYQLITTITRFLDRFVEEIEVSLLDEIEQLQNHTLSVAMDRLQAEEIKKREVDSELMLLVSRKQ